MKKLPAYFLFGNYFYGVCTVGLAIETSLQFHLPLNPIWFYLLLFSATVLYYTFSYTGLRRFLSLLAGGGAIPYPAQPNERSLWYYKHAAFIRHSLRLFTVILIGSTVLAAKVLPEIHDLNASALLLLISAPLLAAGYAGLGRHKGKALSLRNSGWLKPFVIGMVWGIVVTIYPLLFHYWSAGNDVIPDERMFWLLSKNWMFISVLCILFDIKDYADDANRMLKTFVVQAGLRKTLFYIILPLSFLGLAAFLIYARHSGFCIARILINTIPFIFLIGAAYSLQQRRPIYYYLFAIDGLMLIKAACGSIAALYC